MAIDVEPNMGLHRWNAGTDLYDYTLDLIADKNKLGSHTHGGAPNDGLGVKGLAAGILANRPAQSLAGHVYFATDANGGLGALQIDDGAAWKQVPLSTGNGLTVMSGGIGEGIAAATNIGLNLGGVITAAGALAASIQIAQNLTAAVNGDVMTALIVNPTFTVGGFTGTTSLGVDVRAGGVKIAGNVGIGAAPLSQAAIYVSTNPLNASAGSAYGITIQPVLVAQVNNDVLYGLHINPTYNANAKTGVVNIGAYVGAGGLQVQAGNIGIASAPQAHVAIYAIPSLTAVSGSTQGFQFNGTLIASANNDALYGLYIGPTYNDNGKTGVLHAAAYLGGVVGIGAFPTSEMGLNLRPTLNAVGAQAVGIISAPTLVAQVNGDALYGMIINPTYNDNGKTGVNHTALSINAGKIVAVSTSLPARVGGDVYLVWNPTNGEFHQSAIGPAS